MHRRTPLTCRGSVLPCQQPWLARRGPQAPQRQAGPQLHPAPHWQAAAETGAVCWQPQVQDAPGQVSQVQVVGWVDMVDSSRLGEPP